MMVFAPGSLLAQNPLEDVLPPDIMPVVIVSGSDYEMGYQYGQQAGHLIERRIDAYWASCLQTLSREQVEHQLRAIQYYAKQFTPEVIAQTRGLVAGATAAGFDVSFTDVLLLNSWLPGTLGEPAADPETHPFPAEAEGEVIPTKGCSVASAWGSATRTGRLIGMDVWDEGDAVYQVLIVAFPDEGNNYISGAHAGDIGSHFLMNNKGLFVGNSGGGDSRRAEDRDFGLSWSMSLPHLVRFANTAVEARDMLLPWHIDCPENFHFADVHGSAFVVEKTPAIQGVRKPGDFEEEDFLFSTNNYLIEEMSVTKEGDFVGEHGGYGAGSSAISRNMLLWDMLHNYHGHVDAEFMKMILRFPGDGPPYPPAGGWETMVLRPTNSRVAVVAPDDGDEGVVYVCTGPAGRVLPAVKGRPAFPYVNGPHTFFRLTLAASPREVVAEARAAAANDIASAYAAFMGMNYTDAGYAPLKDLYDLANRENYQGHNFYNRGVLSSDRDAIFNLARAATAYTRAQAHARQVYEALNPPPTSPSDLGLRPFGGDWATWETKVGRSK
jgi:hypothetical protein